MRIIVCRNNMKIPNHEQPKSIEQECKQLRADLLDCIARHNADSSRREVKPIDTFGESAHVMQLFWANWADDALSTHMVGFTYRHDKGELWAIGGKEPIPFEAAPDLFLVQLAEIPKRSDEKE